MTTSQHILANLEKKIIDKHDNNDRELKRLREAEPKYYRRLYNREFWQPILFRFFLWFAGAMAIVIALAFSRVSLKLIGILFR